MKRLALLALLAGCAQAPRMPDDAKEIFPNSCRPPYESEPSCSTWYSEEEGQLFRICTRVVRTCEYLQPRGNYCPKGQCP